MTSDSDSSKETFRETIHDRRGRPRRGAEGRALDLLRQATLEWLRHHLRLSQRAFAARIGITQGHYSALARGAESVGPKTDPFAGALVVEEGESLHPLVNPMEWMLAKHPPQPVRGGRGAGRSLFSSEGLVKQGRIKALEAVPSIDRLVLALEVGAGARPSFERHLSRPDILKRRGTGEFADAAMVPGVGFIQWGHQHSRDLAWLTLYSDAIADGRARPWVTWARQWAHPAQWITRWEPALTYKLTHSSGRLLVHGGRLAEELRSPDCPILAPFALNNRLGRKQNRLVRSYDKDLQLRDLECNCYRETKRGRSKNPACTCEVSGACQLCAASAQHAYRWRVEGSLRASAYRDASTFVAEQPNPFDGLRVLALDRVDDLAARFVFIGGRLHGASHFMTEIVDAAFQQESKKRGLLRRMLEEQVDRYERLTEVAVPTPRRVFEQCRPVFQALLNYVFGP